MPDVKPENLEFAQRLANACEASGRIPEKNHGRQTWLSEQLNVSREGVRKWFAGLSRPRTEVMTRLAELLEVDQAWLALGINPTRTPRERRALDRAAGGAVYYVAGAIEMAGGSVAFPEEPRDDADLYAIVKGRQMKVHVALGERVAPAHYRLVVPEKHQGLTVIGAIPTFPLCPTLILLPPGAIELCSETRGGYRELEVTVDGDQVLTGDFSWPLVRSFAEPMRDTG